MKSYTTYDLGMNVDGAKYVLPDDLQRDLQRDPQLERVKNLFVDQKNNILFLNKKEEIHDKWGTIELPCLYEGYDGYYEYTLCIEVFQLKDGPCAGKYMIAMRTESEHGDLLLELIDMKVIPNIISQLGLCKITASQ